LQAARGAKASASWFPLPKHGDCHAGLKEGKQASSFLKKRSKKLLSLWRALDATPAPGEKSFFGSFFSKKELLPS
jgi:hypothetical protein